MKKAVLIIGILISQISLSQELLTTKSGGRVYDINNQKIKPNTMRESLKDDQKALKLYNAGRSKKTVGNIILWTSLITFAGKYYSDTRINTIERNPYNPSEIRFKSTENTLYFVAGGLFLISIPIKIGFEKKIKKCVDLINESDAKSKEATLQYNSEIIANSNGIGFKITF